MKRLLPLLMLLTLLTGCTLYDHMTVTELTLTVTPETIIELEDYRKLTAADLTGSTCYAEIEAYKAAHPEVTVTYTVELFGTWYDPSTTTALDLSTMTADQIPTLLDTLQWLPKVTDIALNGSEGTAVLSLTEVKTLTDALPEGITVSYAFDLFGQTLDLTTERIEFVNTEIGDDGEERIRQTLDLLPSCSYLKLDNCGLSNEVMAKLRDDYPDTKVVWRVWYGKNNRFCALTDETVVRSSHYLTNETVYNMRYLTDVVYMDIGHNETLTDISFCAFMPKLKLLIVSGAPVEDISPLAGLTELEFLELCFCGWLEDISPLADCTGLKYLNIAGSCVKDLSALDDLPIERFMAISTNRLPYAQRTAFAEKHPDCLSVYKGVQPYGYGWRYIDDGYTFWEYYATMRKIFHYDQLKLLNGYEWDEATKNDPW